MNLDVAVLVLVLGFGLWGLITGAARQLGRSAGLAAAVFGAVPLGQLATPWLASTTRWPVSLATVAATVGCFAVLYLVVHLALSAVLKRVFDGAEGDRRTVDRPLGFVLGASKAALLCYLSLCAMVLLENTVVVQGRRLVIAPKDSLVVRGVRHFNLLERHQFSGVDDVVTAARAAIDPKRREALKADRDFTSLLRDARFERVLKDDAAKRALLAGDVSALLESESVGALLADPEARAKLERAATKLDRK